MLNNTLVYDHEDLFVCPICSRAMKLLHLKSLVCEKNHCFDLSKQGYLNLLSSVSKVKYDKRMFEARRLISKSGFFDPICSKISEIILEHIKPGESKISIMDAGYGEGSHLATVRSMLLQSLVCDILSVGVDISKEGILLSSKHYSNMIWCVADLAKCPFADHQFDYILNILSPSNYSEFRRMLSNDGVVNTISFVEASESCVKYDFSFLR